MKTSAFDPLGSLTWQSLMSQGDKVTFLILYSFNRLIIISSDGKQAILTVNNLPRPQGTGLGNAGNNGEKLKIVPIIYYHQVKGGKKFSLEIHLEMFIHISSKTHPEHIGQLKKQGTHWK